MRNSSNDKYVDARFKFLPLNRAWKLASHKLEGLEKGDIVPLFRDHDWVLFEMALYRKGCNRCPKYVDKDKVQAVCITQTPYGLLVDFILDYLQATSTRSKLVADAFTVNMDHPECSERGEVLYKEVPGSRRKFYRVV